ncbi:Zn-ribbon protein [Thalassotalea sp. ND16A]|uniref:Zn-ribbon protein n=1 Tax=Thalassotalea sp. ND16A TaxID=1535422 RepID=UPI00051A2FEB|nr:Zn-ribbon protein [Thalassotalea sp. ND16A]KGJ98356.1 hypothetical protein ND16A_0665 [Thalassotalea sp. ND16A]
MALINCPSCSKRISSKAVVCQHCQCVLADMSEEQRLSMQKISKIEQSQKLMNQSMIAMLLFCGGFGFMFWGEPEPTSWQYSLATGSAVIGFAWYILNRARIIWLKRK